MEKDNLRRISFSSSSSSTLANFKFNKNYKQANKKWEWLDLSDTTTTSATTTTTTTTTLQLYTEADNCSERERKGYSKREDVEGEENDSQDNESFIQNWTTTSLNNDHQHQQDPNVEQENVGNYPSINPSNSPSGLVLPENSNPSSDFSNEFGMLDFDDYRFPGQDLANFYQTDKKNSSEPRNHRSFSTLSASSNARFVGRFLDHKPLKNNKINNKIGFHSSRTSNTAFTSSNIYLRPLPANFTPLDLHELCMSMVRSPNVAEKHKKFHILSVKVMIEEEDKNALGTCKGFGFCLWNSVQASTACIEGLRAHGYQASFARESSRAMLSSLADPTSANIYLSNLPHHWGEDELKELFGDTPIASARLLRDRDDEAVGSGASRGVGFVRLACRSDALHFVELLHGMPIPGTNCHLQCRMADSQAQKEWKRNIRSSFKQPSTSDESSPQKNQSPDSTSSKKWSIKKPAHHATPNVPSVITPDRRASVAKPPHQSMPPSYSEPGLEGIRGGGGGGFHVVGLGSPGGPVLIPPPFHAPSPLSGHGPTPIIAATNKMSPAVMAPTGNEIQRLFPIAPAFFPLYPPTWYPQQACPALNFSPGSNYSSMNTSPYPHNWSHSSYVDHHSTPPPPPANLPHQKSFGYYYPDSSLSNPLPQNDQFNDLYDSNKNLNIIDQNSSDQVHSNHTQPLTSSGSIQEFYSTDSSIKILDQGLSNNNVHENIQQQKEQEYIK